MIEETRFYRAQERAFAPGIVREWPKVFQMPRKVPHGRLVKVSLSAVVTELRELGYFVLEPHVDQPGVPTGEAI